MSKKHFLRGLRDGIPIGLGYFAVSFGIGISAHNAHLSIFQGFLLSFLNNASSGEYGGITIIAADSGLWAMALMMLVVNARYLLMSCALSQRLSPDTPLPWRLLIAYDLTDEIFGLAIAQPGYLEVWYYFGTMCAAMPGWSIGTVLGVLMGNLMPVWAVSGCSVMLFGMFLAIIIPVPALVSLLRALRHARGDDVPRHHERHAVAHRGRGGHGHRHRRRLVRTGTSPRLAHLLRDSADLRAFYRVSKSCKSTLRGFRWVFIKQSTERIDTDTLHFSCQHTM